jgi:hypothetical protein
MMEMESQQARPLDYEQRRNELDSEWRRLNAQKPYAWLLFLAGGALFISNFFGVNEPTDSVLGGITLAAVAAGAFWLWNLRKEIDRVIRLSVENDKQRPQ